MNYEFRPNFPYDFDQMLESLGTVQEFTWLVNCRSSYLAALLLPICGAKITHSNTKHKLTTPRLNRFEHQRHKRAESIAVGYFR